MNLNKIIAVVVFYIRYESYNHTTSFNLNRNIRFNNLELPANDRILHSRLFRNYGSGDTGFSKNYRFNINHEKEMDDWLARWTRWYKDSEMPK